MVEHQLVSPDMKKNTTSKPVELFLSPVWAQQLCKCLSSHFQVMYLTSKLT